jgi:hypothetical protein
MTGTNTINNFDKYLINSLIYYLLHENTRSSKLSFYIDMPCKAYEDLMSSNKYTLFEIWYLKVTYYIICNKKTILKTIILVTYITDLPTTANAIGIYSYISSCV